MHELDQVERLRMVALGEAIRLYADRQVHGTGHTPAGQVVAAAKQFFDFLYSGAPAATLVFSIGTIVDQETGTPSPNQYNGGILTMLDTEQTVISVAAEDSKNQPTADTFSWSLDDAGVAMNATLIPSADTQSATLGGSGLLPGTATVSAVDPNGLTGTIAVVVTAGTATQLVLTQGTPTPQA